MRFRSPTAESTGFQIAPMIDIVFLLLIFFIVTWKLARFETEIEIAVPAAEEGTQDERPIGEIIVNVHSDGRMVVNAVVLDDAQLLQKLKNVAALREDQPVILRGDEESAYKHIVKVLDICKKAGIWNVAFATQHPEMKARNEAAGSGGN